MKKLISALSFVFSSLQIFAQGPPYSWLAITNPMAAATNSDFGRSVAAVGNNAVLIGAPFDNTGATAAGVAYLFGTNGGLITTITNPAPAENDEFGWSVASLGTDRVLVGAPSAHRTGRVGEAYLFSTNGALITTITNPTHSDSFFGSSVAAVGTNRVLVGAYGYNYSTGLSLLYVGAAYLFNTNGVLLTTFDNPRPTNETRFGWSVAALGANRVLIGDPQASTGVFDSGKVYLFRTNGALLATFTKPTPAEHDDFGISVTAVGSDRVLIGAMYDDTGATNAGAAYLFNTNGGLVTTFTNPAPAAYADFGQSVAAVRRDRVAIGFASIEGGGVHYFDTSGNLLTTFTNPAPAIYEGFGSSVAAVGNYAVLVGTSLTYITETSSQASVLFYLPQITPPSLSVRLTVTNTVVVSWPSPVLFDPADWVYWSLQQTTNLNAPTQWRNTSSIDNGTTGTRIADPPAGTVFYRLFKPPL